MQTLHLRFQALRAISPGHSPGRWPSPSLRTASTWKGALPLPNLPRPTLAVGLPSAAKRCGMKGPPGLSNSPGPICAIGWRPASRHPGGILCPVTGAGLPGASRLRAARKDSRGPVFPYRVCQWQTARHLSPYPAPHEAGDLGADDGQARASTTLRAVSPRPSFPLRPRLCVARAYGKKMADRTANVVALAGVSRSACRQPDGSGILHSEATGLRPTGRLKAVPYTREPGQASASSCARTPALVTGQERVGIRVPGPACRWCGRACLRFRRGVR